MLYVLKFVGNGPDNFMENCYDEVVVIKNRIALVQFEHNANMLRGMNFEFVGMVEKEEDLKELFRDKTVEIKTTTQIVQLQDILPDNKPETIEGSQKSWYENLE